MYKRQRLCRYEMVLTNDYYYSREWIEWASKEDENRVKDFLHTGLDSYEAEIGWKKQDQAYDRKQRPVSYTHLICDGDRGN